MVQRTDGDAGDPGEVMPDERLRLIFTRRHPALAQESQMALTLRLVCRVPAPDIARAFLVSEPAMAARITRAKKKISTARIPTGFPACRAPGPPACGARRDPPPVHRPSHRAVRAA